MKRVRLEIDKEFAVTGWTDNSFSKAESDRDSCKRLSR